jgi:hypothetical protein
MKKRELKLALRTASRLCRETEFFLIGSQAVHAYCSRPPAEVLLSQECDLYPRNRPLVADLIHNQLGRNSKFSRRYGIYIDVVTPELASLPNGWRKRLKLFHSGSITAYCLEVHDLLVSKLAAGRLKDLELAAALLKRRIAAARTLRRRIGQFPITSERQHIRTQMDAVLKKLK